MLSALLIVIPIFALILVGWLAGRFGVLGPHATAEINRFVIWLALPALLFDVIANANWSDLWQPGFIAVFALSGLLSMGLALFVCLSRHGNLTDAAIEGLNAGYSNIGFVGFPIVLIALGREALVPATIGAIITMCIIFALAIVLIETGLQTAANPHHLARKVGRTLVRNPILVASVTAAAFPLLDIGVPAPAQTFLKLLGGAASPCALVALGLFLAAERPTSKPRHGVTAFLVSCKLLLHPVLAWGLARFVIDLSPFSTQAVVLLAALPAGTGSFMLAEYYRREAEISSRTIVISTLVSIATISLCIGAIRWVG